jgi:hypothetical protein
MNPSQEQQLFRDLAEAMRGMPERILARQLVDFYKAHPDYGCGAADALGMGIQRYAPWPKKPPKPPIESYSLTTAYALEQSGNIVQYGQNL